jgi:hypothetical protein
MNISKVLMIFHKLLFLMVYWSTQSQLKRCSVKVVVLQDKKKDAPPWILEQ